jgi:outer membrane receptor for ferrienterochelin and colicins
LYTKIYQSRYKKRNDTTALNWQDLGYFSQDDSSNSGMNANVKITSHEAYLQSLVSDAHLLTTGFEYRDEDRDGTSFNQAGTYERRTFKYKALYLQDEWSVADRFNLTLGARYDDISNSDNKITFKVGANYELDNFVNLRAGFSQGYRVADTKERYISKQTPTGLQLGSDVIRGPKTTKYNLKPESINAYEIGLGGRDDKFGYDLAIFYNDVKDRIEMVNKGSYFTFENIDDSYTYGFEGSISHDINRKFATDFSYIYIKSENKQTKKDLLLTPKHSLRVALKYKPINNLSLSGDLRYVGKQDYEYTNSLIQNVRKTSEGVFYVDANINYKTDNFLFHGSVENIFGGKSDDNFFVDNGRVFYAGIRYYF